MKILITGANGQLGLCLQDQLKAQNINHTAYSSRELDITNEAAVREKISYDRPSVIINAAAYTQVDKAESEPEKAYAVNCTGAKNLALAAKEIDAALLHVSTDYVFDGESSTPYKETDNTNPQSVYGLTKLQGEQAIAGITERHIILRTAWVFSEYGNNFVKTMLRLGQERETLSIVNDQTGCPTYAGDIAIALIKLSILIDKDQADNLWGIYHYCGNESVSWFEFAQVILNSSAAQHMVTKKPTLNGISSSSYPTPAARPKLSTLSCKKIQSLEIKQSNWKEKLQKTINA